MGLPDTGLIQDSDTVFTAHQGGWFELMEDHVDVVDEMLQPQLITLRQETSDHSALIKPACQ